MASCSQYAAAFGFQLYLVPVSACGLDLSTVSGGLKDGGFFNPVATLSEGIKIEEGATAGEILAGDPGVNVVFDGETQLSEYVFKMRGLTNAGLETDTGNESIITYDEEGRGFDQSVAISKSWTISIEGVSKFDDAAYKVLRILEANAVSGQLKCKVGRIGPTGTTEAVYGYATVANYSESVESGSIVTWSAELQGYGPLNLDLDNTGSVNLIGPIQTLSILNAGSNLLDTTYTDQLLTGGSGNGLATADIIVSGGVVSDVTLTEGGDGYAELEVLGANLQGAVISGVLQDPLTVSSGGLNLADGTYTGLSLTGGTGTGGTVDATVAGNVLTSVTVVGDGGQDYTAADVLTVTGLPAAPNPDLGAVQTFTNLQGGSGYADGTFLISQLTGGTGSGLFADIQVSGGSVTGVTITDGGSGYTALDEFTFALDPAIIPGTGQVLTFTVTDPGTNLADGTFNSVNITGGSGSSFSLDLTVAGGVVTGATINTGGLGYVAGDSALTANLSGAITPGTGALVTADLATAGSGLADGTYVGLDTTTDGSGTLATIELTISGGQVSSFVINNTGAGYQVGDTITVDAPGAPDPQAGEILTADEASFAAGSGYGNGNFTNVPLTGGNGTGALGDFSIGAGGVDSFQLVDGGLGYQVGDTLSVDGATQLGAQGGIGFETTVLTVQPDELPHTDPTLSITSVDEDTEQAHTDPTFSVDTVDEDSFDTIVAWSVQAGSVDENTLLVKTDPEVTSGSTTTREAVHTDPTFRITALVDNDNSGG